MRIIFRGRGMPPLVMVQVDDGPTIIRENWKPPLVVQVDDRPILEETPDGVVLVVPARNGEYRVELTLDDCQRIAESIAEEATP
jgi:hypothetical protein